MSDVIKNRLFTLINKVAGKQLSSSGKSIDIETLFSTPLDALDIDSITFLEIIMEVEDEFDITLGEVDPDHYASFADVENDLLQQLQDA